MGAGWAGGGGRYCICFRHSFLYIYCISQFFKLKINIKETHYYSDAPHVPRALSWFWILSLPPPFFIILSLYTISSQPDHDLHSPWDPFHQDVNRQRSPSHLKTTNPNLIWRFCLLFPFSTELQKRVVGPHFLHFFISHYSSTLSIQAFVFITSSLKTDVFLALRLVSSVGLSLTPSWIIWHGWLSPH